MINTEEAKQNNISLKRLQRLEIDGELERVAQGLYLHKDFVLDPFYLAQYRSSKVSGKQDTPLKDIPYMLNYFLTGILHSSGTEADQGNS